MLARSTVDTAAESVAGVRVLFGCGVAVMGISSASLPSSSARSVIALFDEPRNRCRPLVMYAVMSIMAMKPKTGVVRMGVVSFWCFVVSIGHDACCCNNIGLLQVRRLTEHGYDFEHLDNADGRAQREQHKGRHEEDVDPSQRPEALFKQASVDWRG